MLVKCGRMWPNRSTSLLDLPVRFGKALPSKSALFAGSVPDNGTLPSLCLFRFIE